MKSVNPTDLLPHRVFFTEFDRYGNPARLQDPRQYQAIQALLHRKLKLLILTKGHVVIAASQLLESPLAHALLRQHPNLLSTGTVVSSMKLGHINSVQFLSTKRDETRTNPNSPFHKAIAEDVAMLIDQTGTVVRWNLSDMSDWFRDRLATDLLDEQSLLRLTLRNQGIVTPQNLAQEIKAQSALTRDKVDSLASTYQSKGLRDILVAYSDFLYYLSGARTTRSEGVLPQENLVDFSLTDLVGRKTKLSESEIFFKIFIDTVKAKTSTIFPTDFLDSISIDDAIELRSIALSRQFIEKYNSIQLKTKEALDLNDPERLVLLLQELDQFETELSVEFSAALDKELPTRLRETKQRATGTVIHSIASLLIPFYDAPNTVRDIVVSGLTLMGKREAADAVNKKINQGVKACENALENMNIIDRQVLLDFVDEMRVKYKSKM